MVFLSEKALKKILKEQKIFLKKRLGQNFLIKKEVLKKIVNSAELSQKDLVLEVGPGLGNLTEELAKRAKKVIAIEKDERLIKPLSQLLKNYKNVKILKGDILKIKNPFLREKYKLVANIPYYLTGILIRKFLEEKNKPKLMVLLVQKEIAERICACPPKMNLLAVSVQYYGKPQIVDFVPKDCFWPSPRVDSAILKISLQKTFFNKKETRLFFKIVKAGFSQRRKQILNNFSKMLKLEKEEAKNWLLKTNIKPEERAENLKMGDWFSLTFNFLKNVDKFC